MSSPDQLPHPEPVRDDHHPEEFFSVRTMELADQAVQDVFNKMLGGLTAQMVKATSTTVRADRAEGEVDDLWATVRFGGLLRGACEIRMTPTAAGFLAAILLGLPVSDDDESLKEAVGELCNIIGGGWKNRVFTIGSRCSLSPPTILSGATDLLGSPIAHATRTYEFDGHSLRLTFTQEEEGA